MLSLVEDVDRYRFTEPGPFQHGELEVTSEDIITNLPFRDGCAMWFDHHTSNEVNADFRGAWWVAPSAARVIYDHYMPDDRLTGFRGLVEITDRIDSANLTMEEVKNPRGYVLVSMTVEGKRPQDEPYWRRLIELIRENDLAAMLADPEVDRRCAEFMTVNQEFGQAIELYSELDGNVLVTDFRRVWNGESGNRFLAYTLFPRCDIWVKAMDNPNDPRRAHISVGHSIFNRTSKVDVGELMSRYGGGGHRGAGSCRPLKEDADRVLREIIEVCRNDIS